MSAQVEETSAQAQELAHTAEPLKLLVARFKLDDADGERQPAALSSAQLRRAA
jgi:hypothetical protein